MKNKLSLSNILILISAAFTLLATLNVGFYKYGMNSIFLNNWEYHIYALQLFTSQFLHGWFLHFFMNGVFIFIFWNYAENILWEKKYSLFFIFSVIFIGIWLTLFSDWNTVGISGFAMAVMAFYTLHLKSIHNPDYKWWITALIINIGIWFSPWISLLWHLFWAISWAIYFFILQWIKR